MIKKMVLAVVLVLGLTFTAFPASAREKVEVQLLGTRMGTGGYAMCHGLSGCRVMG